jgi:hypothetical protein
MPGFCRRERRDSNPRFTPAVCLRERGPICLSDAVSRLCPHMRLRPPSPALVVACLALAISLSGAAYAVSTALPRNSVGTVQLKNNAVNSAKVRNASLRAADFAPGQIPAGLQGPAGPQGRPGASGLRLISGSGVSNSSSPKSQQQDCPAGKRAVGGGGVITGSATNTFLSTSRPTDPGTGWIATGRESTAGTAGNWAVQTWVVCVTVAP